MKCYGLTPRSSATRVARPPTRRTAALLALAVVVAGAPTARAQTPAAAVTAPTDASVRSDAYQTARAYLATFYPLWFTYYQSIRAEPDQLVAPKSVTPLYQTVVAINVDTVYASAFLDLSKQPAILTIPETTATFSVLTLDPYGNVFDPPQKFVPGVYALVGPGGYDVSALPAGATVVQLPVEHPTMIFRADTYASDGTDQTEAATTFRNSLRMVSLSDFNAGKSGETRTLSALNYAIPFKLLADKELEVAPMLFLHQLADAVASDRTPPMTQSESALSAHFKALYDAGQSRAELSAGAQAAHQLIVNNYLDNRGATNWVHFSNIGHWGSELVDRASITEFLQYGNDLKAAGYYHVFRDGNGVALDGAQPGGYEIVFPPHQPPTPQRFWSITAYTPDAVELVPNSLRKYNVASYTPGLVYGADGSLTIFVGLTKPEGVADANFLPVLPGKFNLMLRFYGTPEQVVDGSYVPPPVIRRW